MRNTWKALSAGVAISILLSGCMSNVGDLGRKNIRTNQLKFDANGNIIRDKRFANDGMNEMNRINGRMQMNNNLVGSHKNYRLEMSQSIGDKIRGIVEVKSAYVMLADNNAYVALSLADRSGELKGLSRSEMGKMDRDRIVESRRISSLSTAEEMLTPELMYKVKSVVKENRPAVEHVYVSANPEFVGRMTAYFNDVQLGQPVQKYIAEFNAMAERVFPVAVDDEMTSDKTKSKGRLLD
ncbi:YhcN/YlaJ family sporulation lipoprotein [Paenibacillus sp. J5C2022]|uniref:YhcN/YlaJ family sporulation lipoprotein n=1 Tax=Paenibacillus sp. J5C2022 TaxID=2977129 RepID=UPI0021CED92B|nr:YhcN/YlaJ family sporulation lipoprotein [Paenibacillus sp. J5C2022]